MAPKHGYRVKILSCLAVAGLLSWVTYNNSDAIPMWWSYVGMAGSVLCVAGAFRFLQLERYYEGPRTRLVVEPSFPRREMNSRRR